MKKRPGISEVIPNADAEKDDRSLAAWSAVILKANPKDERIDAQRQLARMNRREQFLTRAIQYFMLLEQQPDAPYRGFYVRLGIYGSAPDFTYYPMAYLSNQPLTLSELLGFIALLMPARMGVADVLCYLRDAGQSEYTPDHDLRWRVRIELA